MMECIFQFEGQCKALIRKDCEGCRFYKTAQQLDVERKNTEDRLERLKLAEGVRAKYYGL